VGSDDEINNVAKAALGKALETADYGVAGGDTTYGNQAGRELLEDQQDLRERIKRLEDKQTRTNAEIAELKKSFKVLALASEGYRKIRNRFLETYRRENQLGK